MVRLIIGCGYLGSRVARRWLFAGEDVVALTRSHSRAQRLRQEGITPLEGDITDPSSLPPLPNVDTLLFAVGFDRTAEHSIHKVYVDGLETVLSALPRPITRIVYISSTGVYGQTDGSHVDEDSPCHPVRAGGQACLDAENLLMASRWANRSVILRLAGIYGPGRLPRLQQIRDGAPLTTEPAGVLNLIHVDDAAEACISAADVAGGLPRIVIVSDGHPVVRRVFYDELANQMGLPAPAFSAPGSNSNPTGRGTSNKRVSNRRLLEQLGIRLQYPDYRHGLAAIAKSSQSTGR